MRYVTPGKPVDMVRVLPSLDGRARTTTRLHPRSGHPDRSHSSMGGELWWPQAQAWPSCDWHAEPSAMVPVLQLWHAQVLRLPMPAGAEVFQLLWCPARHRDRDVDEFGPRAAAVWRASGGAGALRSGRPDPDPGVVWPEYLPRPCVVWPEEVEEFPAWSELDADERAHVLAWHESSQWDYWSHVSAAPGTKVGGWPRWIQEPQRPRCTSGHPMDYLLTIASWEYDGGTWEAWLPRDDADALRAEAKRRGLEFLSSEVGPLEIGSGIRLDGVGDMHVFVCTQCSTWPISTIIQF